MGLFGSGFDFGDITDAVTGRDLYGGLFGGGGGGMGKGAKIKQGVGEARAYLNRGTAQAADYLRQGYEDLFRSRAQGMIGGFGEMQSRVGAQTASQGLSPDVVQRMMFAPGMQLQAGLGQAQGESGSALAIDLAQLFKGAGGEQAGLSMEALSLWLNKEIAKDSARQQQTAGIIGGIGNMFGGAIGAFGGGGAGAGAGTGTAQQGYNYF